jgi:hypothetical protein
MVFAIVFRAELKVDRFAFGVGAVDRHLQALAWDSAVSVLLSGRVARSSDYQEVQNSSDDDGFYVV